MAANISFASFNLYNFQKAGLKTFHHKPEVSHKEYRAKKEWTRNMLEKVDADVVAFQELWHPDCLEDVLYGAKTSYPKLAKYKTIYIKDNKQPWYNIAVALAVRPPWKLAGPRETIKQFPFTELVKLDEGDGEDDEIDLKIDKFSRTILKVKLKHATSSSTPQVTVFACHLKSKLPARVKKIAKRYQEPVGSAISTIRRTAEATALRMMLIDQMKEKNTPTVVLGDLNDDPNSNTVNLMTDQPTMTRNSTGSTDALYSTLFLQQLQSFRDVFYTHEYKNHKGVLDHILVSEEFFEGSNNARWSHQETTIWNDHIEDDDPYTSDHGIIKSSFA